MKAVLTVIGKDMVGILAKVASSCELDELGTTVRAAVPDMVIHVMHEDIFNSMHRI